MSPSSLSLWFPSDCHEPTIVCICRAIMCSIRPNKKYVCFGNGSDFFNYLEKNNIILCILNAFRLPKMHKIVFPSRKPEKV